MRKLTKENAKYLKLWKHYQAGTMAGETLVSKKFGVLTFRTTGVTDIRHNRTNSAEDGQLCLTNLTGKALRNFIGS